MATKRTAQTETNGHKKLRKDQEIRRSGAAGPHKSAKDYRRKGKYPAQHEEG